MNIAPLAERTELLDNINFIRRSIWACDSRDDQDLIIDLKIDLAITLYCLFHGNSIADGYQAHGQGFIPQWIYDLAR